MKTIVYNGQNMIDIPDLRMQFNDGQSVTIMDDSVADMLLAMDGFTEQKPKKTKTGDE